MKEMTVKTISDNPRMNKYLIPAITLVVVLLLGFLSFRAQQQKPGTVVVSTITQNALEADYGLRVNLVAVTAAGGLVDVRIKLIDAEKAKLLLSDKKNFPSLWIDGRQVALTLSEEVISQEIQFENDANLYLMFPNAGSAVQKGTPVTIRFGDIALDAIAAQ